MQLEFREKQVSCLQQLKWEAQEQEQTLEVRLADSLPDIGKVLGAWGQVLLRSKDWRDGSAGVSGGVMVWVMYAPEDGSQVCCVDGWIPFQMRWDIPDTPRDGNLLVSALLQSVDARSTSARKLMLRACVSAVAQIVVPGEVTVYEPGELPEDVRLLRRKYSVRIPVEAGEKPFQIDEILQPPADPAIRRLIRYELQPEIVDQKILAGKGVFRGSVNIHILYEGEDGLLHGKDYDIGFSQFSELEREYDDEAQLRLIPAVTSLEMELNQDGKLAMKAGLTGQYIVSDMMQVEAVEDACSPERQVKVQTCEVMLPATLEKLRQTLRTEKSLNQLSTGIADLSVFASQPVFTHKEDDADLSVSGQMQLLYYDAESVLQCDHSRWQENWTFPLNKDTAVQATAQLTGRPRTELGGGVIHMEADVLAEGEATARKGIEMVCSLELGEKKEPDPGRPSLILCRPEGMSAWELAKKHGSTVEQICKANDLSDENLPDRVLLIPIP